MDGTGQLAATAFYVHDYRLGLQACEVLLKQNRLPSDEIERNRKNHEAYTQKVAELDEAQKKMAQQQAVPAVAPAINTTIRTFKKRRK